MASTMFFLNILYYHIVAVPTQISGVWPDDFATDANGNTGWNQYQTAAGDLIGRSNPTICSLAADSVVHGQTYHVFDPHGATFTMERNFLCQYESKVYVTFHYAFCRTEAHDTVTLYKLDGTASSPIYNMDIATHSSIESFELWDWSSSCTSGVGLPGLCNETPELYFDDSASNVYVGTNNASVQFTVKWQFRTDDIYERVMFYNIQVQCDPVTPSPTTDPTSPTSNPTADPTSPTSRPTSNPTGAPTTPAPSESVVSAFASSETGICVFVGAAGSIVVCVVLVMLIVFCVTNRNEQSNLARQETATFNDNEEDMKTRKSSMGSEQRRSRVMNEKEKLEAAIHAAPWPIKCVAESDSENDEDDADLNVASMAKPVTRNTTERDNDNNNDVEGEGEGEEDGQSDASRLRSSESIYV